LIETGSGYEYDHEQNHIPFADLPAQLSAIAAVSVTQDEPGTLKIAALKAVALNPLFFSGQ
jgi:hypothetical protein